MRRTPERFAILNTIYSINGHFDVDYLLDLMLNQEKFRVSRATLYNTVNLLESARLVIRHQIGDKAQFEKCYNAEAHHHLICTRCGKVTELHDDALQKAIMAAPARKFDISYYSLYMYGLCPKCQRAQKKAKDKTNK